jgi:Flp pilus assembly pilin Flp
MGTHFHRFLAELRNDEEGASLVEYILLAVLIGVAAIAGLSFLGGAANNRMNNIATTLQTQPS